MNVCPKCGAQFEDGVQFCQNCGSKRGRPVVKKNMSAWYKSWHYTVSTICYSDYWLVFVRSIVLYAGGTSRPDDYDFTREGWREIS